MYNINNIFPSPVYIAKRDSDLILREEKEIEKIIKSGMLPNKGNNSTFNTYVFDSKLIDSRIKTKKIKIAEINNNKFDIIDALDQLELVKSRSETKRLINSNGIKVNDENYKKSDFSLSSYISNNEIKISVGKKKIGIINIIKK